MQEETGAITHRADNHYHPVLEMEIDDGFEAVDYRYYSDGLETVDHGDYSDGSLFDLQNGSILPLNDTLLASII
jgi:hypothetical protein